jgi:hypothetical protein
MRSVTADRSVGQGRGMLRRVSSLSTLGEIDVLSVEECEDLTDAVLDLRDEWTGRSPTAQFFTLGVNAYMDLAHSTDSEAEYYALAQRANLLLKHRFVGLHGNLAEVLSHALGVPTRYADDLAMPGFHIWVGPGIPSRAGASIHFDLQYQRLLHRPAYARATGTVSFTLPIRLPAAGSSLRLWPACTYPADVSHLDIARTTEPEVVRYRLGSALVHSGHVLHQIGPTPSVQPEDLRITLQGHGLVVDDVLVLYW